MLSALGDAIRVLPVVNALKRAWPGVRITWFIEELPHRLLQRHEAVDEFVVVPRRTRNLPQWLLSLRQAARGRRFDLAIDLQVGLKAGLLTAFIDADAKLGFDRGRARDGNWLFTSARIPARPLRHAQLQYFEFLEHLGIDPYPVEWRLELTPEERTAQASFFDGLGHTCALAFASSAAHKNWAPERYARLLEHLELDYGFTCILVGAPSDEHLAAEIVALAAASPIVATGLGPLMYVLDGSDLAISPDSAPLHIAAALGTPVIGLFGATNPKRYAPLGPSAALVVDGFARRPGEAYLESAGTRRGGMDRISVEAVLAMVKEACA